MTVGSILKPITRFTGFPNAEGTTETCVRDSNPCTGLQRLGPIYVFLRREGVFCETVVGVITFPLLMTGLRGNL